MWCGRFSLVTLLLWPPAASAMIESQCLPCHPKQVIGYAKTAMASSLSHSVPLPSGNFVHPLSRTRFSVASSNGKAHITMTRDGLSAASDVDYVIGSGRDAYGGLVRV